MFCFRLFRLQASYSVTARYQYSLPSRVAGSNLRTWRPHNWLLSCLIILLDETVNPSLTTYYNLISLYELNSSFMEVSMIKAWHFLIHGRHANIHTCKFVANLTASFISTHFYSFPRLCRFAIVHPSEKLSTIIVAKLSKLYFSFHRFKSTVTSIYARYSIVKVGFQLFDQWGLPGKRFFMVIIRSALVRRAFI